MFATSIDEVAPDIYRVSTFVEAAGIDFNQILVNADEPFLFHTGMRGLFPFVSEAIAKVMPLERLRWISFGHTEADECGSMNMWLAAAPKAEVTFGGLGCLVSINDLADRAPRPLNDGDVIDLGGKRMRYLATPHVPHGWDSGVFFEETTGTLLCGDLFTQMGHNAATSSASPLDAAIGAEEAFGATCLTPNTAPTIERLAGLKPTALAMMHGPTHIGDAPSWLHELAVYYADRHAAALQSV